MDNRKILNLTKEEVIYFATVYDTAYTVLSDHYNETNNKRKLGKLNQLTKKIDIYIANNIKGENK